MILLDTTVWIDHFRYSNSLIEGYLLQEAICIHPFVIGELALGSLSNRAGVLAALDALPHINVADSDEVRHLIESRNLYNKGIGWVDAHLIASLLLHAGIQLWTTDKRLARAAADLSLSLHHGSLPN